VSPLAVSPLAVSPLAVSPLAVSPLAVSPLTVSPLAVRAGGHCGGSPTSAAVSTARHLRPDRSGPRLDGLQPPRR